MVMKIEDIKNPAGYNDLRNFERITREAFQFLITDYEFVQQEPIVAGSECAIEYRNRTTGVLITWEWQYYVIVELARLKVTSGGISIAERHDLEHLLTIRAPDKHLTQKKHPNCEELKRVLDSYGTLTKEYAEDILTGDFSIFPQLMALSLESIERKKAMLGYPKS